MSLISVLFFSLSRACDFNFMRGFFFALAIFRQAGNFFINYFMLIFTEFVKVCVVFLTLPSGLFLLPGFSHLYHLVLLAFCIVWVCSVLLLINPFYSWASSPLLNPCYLVCSLLLLILHLLLHRFPSLYCLILFLIQGIPTIPLLLLSQCYLILVP